MSDWTNEEIGELVRLWPTASAAQIARRLHRAVGAVSGKASRLRHEGLLPAGGVAKQYDVKPWRARSHLAQMRSRKAHRQSRRHPSTTDSTCGHAPSSNSTQHGAIGRSATSRRSRRCSVAAWWCPVGAIACTIGRRARQGRVMLTPNQRRDLLRIEQARDAVAIAAHSAVLADNPDADLLEIEMMLRAAASTAYLVATAEGFTVIVGMKNWVAELDRLGRTPEQNRTLLAGNA